MFIRVRMDDGSEHEWGFNSPAAPAVGDVICLWYAERDEESYDFVESRVVRREFDTVDDSDEVNITVSAVPIPEDCISDSAAWPSDEWSKRKVEWEKKLREMREERDKDV